MYSLIRLWGLKSAQLSEIFSKGGSSVWARDCVRSSSKSTTGCFCRSERGPQPRTQERSKSGALLPALGFGDFGRVCPSHRSGLQVASQFLIQLRELLVIESVELNGPLQREQVILLFRQWPSKARAMVCLSSLSSRAAKLGQFPRHLRQMLVRRHRLLRRSSTSPSKTHSYAPCCLRMFTILV